MAGMIFQYYERIFAVSYISRSITVDKTTIQYRRMKKEILINLKGLEAKVGYYIATPERAFLDTIYIYKNYHFDNLGSIDWNKTRDLSQIYESKSLIRRLDEYYKLFKKEYGKH